MQGGNLLGNDADQKGQDGPVITADFAKAILAGLDQRMGHPEATGYRRWLRRPVLLSLAIPRVNNLQSRSLERTDVARRNHEAACGGRGCDIAVCLANGLSPCPRSRHQVGIGL